MIREHCPFALDVLHSLGRSAFALRCHMVVHYLSYIWNLLVSHVLCVSFRFSWIIHGNRNIGDVADACFDVVCNVHLDILSSDY